MSSSKLKRKLERTTFDPDYAADRCSRCGSAYWPCCSVKLAPSKPIAATTAVRR